MTNDIISVITVENDLVIGTQNWLLDETNGTYQKTVTEVEEYFKNAITDIDPELDENCINAHIENGLFIENDTVIQIVYSKLNN